MGRDSADPFRRADGEAERRVGPQDARRDEAGSEEAGEGRSSAATPPAIAACERTPQSDGEREDHDARQDEVRDLDPAEVAVREQAPLVAGQVETLAGQRLREGADDIEGTATAPQPSRLRVTFVGVHPCSQVAAWSVLEVLGAVVLMVVPSSGAPAECRAPSPPPRMARAPIDMDATTFGDWPEEICRHPSTEPGTRPGLAPSGRPAAELTGLDEDVSAGDDESADIEDCCCLLHRRRGLITEQLLHDGKDDVGVGAVVVLSDSQTSSTSKPSGSARPTWTSKPSTDVPALLASSACIPSYISTGARTVVMTRTSGPSPPSHGLVRGRGPGGLLTILVRTSDYFKRERHHDAGR